MDLEDKIALVCSLIERLGVGTVESVTKKGFVLKESFGNGTGFYPFGNGTGFYPFGNGTGKDFETFLDEEVIPWIAVFEMGLPEDTTPEELELMLESEGFRR